MRACDSVCQNRCRMQGKCVVEAVAIQNTQDRVFLFIRYLYPDGTRPETRKRPKKWADLCEAKVREPSKISSLYSQDTTKASVITSIT